MSSFWSITVFWGSILLSIGVALTFVLPPLLRNKGHSSTVDRRMVNIAIYRDQLKELEDDLRGGELTRDQYDISRLEIEKRLSEDVPAGETLSSASERGRWVGYLVAVAIPVVAVVVYVVLGRPDAMMVAASTPQANNQHDAAAMLASLENKLKKNPDNAPGWYMLGRSYAALGRFQDAAKAMEKTAALMPDDPDVLTDYADVLAMAQGGDLQGKPLDLVNKALTLNPRHEKGLNLAGNAAYQRRDFSSAARYWRELLQQVPKDSELTKEISAAIQEAERAGGGIKGLDNLSSMPTSPGPRDGDAKSVSTGTSPAITGTVSLSDALRASVKPTDTVFIFAQAPHGPKMPLASLKLTVAELPYRFTLDDSMSMLPGSKLSDFPEVTISARISKSGQPLAQSGDLQGKSEPVRIGKQGVNLKIDTVVP